MSTPSTTIEWHIPPPVFDLWATLEGHLSALKVLKQLIDDLHDKTLHSFDTGIVPENVPAYVHEFFIIRNHFKEHVRRFQDDFAQPQDVPLGEAKDRVLDAIRQGMKLDVDELAWRLRLTRDNVVKACNALKGEGRIFPCKKAAIKPLKKAR